MNVHLLRHIPGCVRNWGPLWAYSCFAFESMNGHLKKFFHGTKNMNTQVRYLYELVVVIKTLFNLLLLAGVFVCHDASATKRPLCKSPQVVSMCGLSSIMYWKLYTIIITYRLKFSDCCIHGTTEQVVLLPDIWRLMFEIYGIDVVVASKFLRATLKGEVFYSKAYQCTKKYNSFSVAYSDGQVVRHGIIQYFISVPSLSVAIITPLTPTTHYCYPHVLHLLHNCISPVVIDSSVVVVPVKFLLNKCVGIDFSNSMFLVKPPNKLLIDWLVHYFVNGLQLV